MIEKNLLANQFMQALQQMIEHQKEIDKRMDNLEETINNMIETIRIANLIDKQKKDEKHL